MPWNSLLYQKAMGHLSGTIEAVELLLYEEGLTQEHKERIEEMWGDLLDIQMELKEVNGEMRPGFVAEEAKAPRPHQVVVKKEETTT